MTTPSPGPPLTELWALLRREIRRRRHATEALDRANTACRQAVVDLLKAGARPRDLYGNPYSEAYVTRIQSEEGLSRRARKRAENAAE